MRDCLYNVLAVHYYMEGNGARLCLYSIYQFQWYLLLVKNNLNVQKFQYLVRLGMVAFD